MQGQLTTDNKNIGIKDTRNEKANVLNGFKLMLDSK
jgi:hypothetical protein